VQLRQARLDAILDEPGNAVRAAGPAIWAIAWDKAQLARPSRTQREIEPDDTSGVEPFFRRPAVPRHLLRSHPVLELCLLEADDPGEDGVVKLAAPRTHHSARGT
jgi:hypothetical protein